MMLDLQKFRELYGEQPKVSDVMPPVTEPRPRSIKEHLMTLLGLLLFFLIGYALTLPLYIGYVFK